MIREGVGEETEKEYPTQKLNEICIKFTSLRARCYPRVPCNRLKIMGWAQREAIYSI